MPIPIRRPRLSTRSLAIFALLVAGCGEGDDGPAVYKVVGKVLVDGQPASRAKVFLHPSPPLPNGVIPYAITGEDGSFRPSTRKPGDGAPAGNYAVTVVWPRPKGEEAGPGASRDKLGGLYNDPTMSDLQIVVHDKENELAPFNLKSR